MGCGGGRGVGMAVLLFLFKSKTKFCPTEIAMTMVDAKYCLPCKKKKIKIDSHHG